MVFRDGKPVTSVRCAGCRVVSEKRRTGVTPRGWARDGKRFLCPACAPKREAR